MRQTYPGRRFIVVGSSYGGFMATQLTKYREFDTLVLRAPAIYRPLDFYTKAKDEDKDAADAFAKAFDADTITIPGITHSLDDATPEQIKDYFDKTYGWLFNTGVK